MIKEKEMEIEQVKMETLEKSQAWFESLFEKSEDKNDIKHSRQTVAWVKKIKPEADEALLVAAALHDVERAIHGDWKAGSDDPEALRKHQDLSVQEAEKFLLSHGADEEFIARVKHLIASHETGGDEDQNVLCDSDCLSFFEDKALRRVKRWKDQGKTKEEMHKNMDYYFSRIITPEAKELARSFYDEAKEEIESEK